MTETIEQRLHEISLKFTEQELKIIDLEKEVKLRDDLLTESNNHNESLLMQNRKAFEQVMVLERQLAESQAQQALMQCAIKQTYKMLLSDPDVKCALFKAENILRDSMVDVKADLLEAMLRKARIETREKCAKKCENIYFASSIHHDPNGYAIAIRALEV